VLWPCVRLAGRQQEHVLGSVHSIQPKPRHPGGRPTKYRGWRTLKQVRVYINSCEDEFEDFKNGRRLVRCKIPTIKGLALHLGVNKDTVQAWKHDHGEFSVLIERLLCKQCAALIHNGLVGYYNPVIAKALLAKHGYREGIEGKSGRGVINRTQI
jgi:DNA-packaging protein gp3